MQKADLPTIAANEPNEGACQPMDMSEERNTRNYHQCNDVSSSQNTGSQPSQALSLPAPGLSPMARGLWLQKRRTTGLWVQCDKCEKWRYIANIIDRYELCNKWFCDMNPDQAVANCAVPEVPIKVRDDEDLIYSEYSTGSLVWARLGNWPWWPAMVDDCPDTEQFYWLDGFSDIPTHYNVVFFDSAEVTRAWLRPNQLKSYSKNKKSLLNVLNNKEFGKRLTVAVKQANDAELLPLSDRLSKYSFIAKYKGKLGKPRKISKIILKKYQNAMQKRFHTEFSEESDSESDARSIKSHGQPSPQKKSMKSKNVVILGTPKKPKIAHNTTDEKIIEVNAPSNNESPIQRNQRNMEIEKSNRNNKSHCDSNLQNSLTVQIGSSVDPSAVDITAIDNDSSKTYVPDTEMAPLTEDLTQDVQSRPETPCSDDFDF